MAEAVTFRPAIERMAGYVPGAQPRGEVWAKLNANENPYPPSPKVLDALREAIGPHLRLYPDAMATPLRETIAQLHGLSPERVLVGNGSDDLLTMVLRSFVGEGEMVVAPRPTYPLYDVLADIQGARMEWADFPPDFALPADLPRRGARVTFLANPNSPSGTWIEPDDVATLAEQVEGVLVVDEAYVDFAEGDCTGLLERFPHVIVLRSFSKSYSLAGVRIGYALASEKVIAGLAKVKDSYNVNRFAVAAGAAALDDIAHMRANAAKIRSERERLTEAFRAMDLFVYPSQANFVALRSGEPSPQAIADALAAEGILVRTFAQPLLEDWVRVTVGTPEQNERLLAVLGPLVEDGRS